MGKYEKLAEDIIKHVGGKENVDSLTHCITRLRFRLKDEEKADDDVLKNMAGGSNCREEFWSISGSDWQSCSRRF